MTILFCLILHKTSRKGKEFISGQPHFIEFSSDVMDVWDMVSLMFGWILARALAVSDLEQVAIKLIILLSLSLSFFQVVTFLPEG